jgi:RNA polymerase sigma factor (sigma-70 family)
MRETPHSCHSFFLILGLPIISMDSSKSLMTDFDDQLIDNLRQGGTLRRKSEEQLFSTYSYFIREGMFKYNISEEDAFEAYSDTVLAAINELIKGLFEHRSSLKTWLYQIFSNKCVDLLRKKSTNKNSVHHTVSIGDWLFRLSDSSRTIIQQLADKADWEDLRQRLDQLGENCKNLLMLAADGYSDKEISTMTDYKTAEVVKTSRLRCMERLRKLYKRPR